MLSELIRLLKEDSGNWSLQQLSRTLDVHPSVVSGMLGLLVAKGLAQEIDPVCGICNTCSIHSKCELSGYSPKRYSFCNKNLSSPAGAVLQES